jgi:2-polyprenyl-6-methoxyphenol hydroxylase-like FAD-dependent oxidoreductase
MSKEKIILQEKARIQNLDNALQENLHELGTGKYRELIIQFYSTLRENKVENNQKKIAIIGLGPTGIAACLEAYKQGFQIVAVEPRGGYSREQAFRFPIADFKQWFADFLAIEDIDKLDENHPLRKIENLGIFVKRHTRIDEGLLFGSEEQHEMEHYEIATRHLETIFYNIISILAEEDKTNLTIINDYSFSEYLDQPKSIRLVKSKYKPQKTLPNELIIENLDYVLGCDGLHSITRQKAGIEIREVTARKTYIAANFYQDTSKSEVPGMVEQFKSIQDDSFLEIQNDPIFAIRQSILYPKLPRKQTSAVEKSQFHGIAAARVFFTAVGTYIGVELRPISSAKNEEQQIVQQCTVLMRTVFSVDPKPSGLKLREYKEHYLREGTIFEVQLIQAKERFKPLVNGILYFPLGDANANAHFQTGSGALYGMKSGQQVAIQLGEGASCEEIDSLLLSIAETLHLRVNNFYDVNTDSREETREYKFSSKKTNQNLAEPEPYGLFQKENSREQDLREKINVAILGKTNISTNPKTELAFENSYLGWMGRKATGTRGITRFSHWFHGDSGVERARNLLEIANNPEATYEEILSHLQSTFEDSSYHKHSLSRYLVAQFNRQNFANVKSMDDNDFDEIKSNYKFK